MKLFLILIALVMGIASTLQGTTNAALSNRQGLGTAVWINALVVFSGASLLWLLLPRAPLAADPARWWHYLGGLFGLTIIASAAYAFPRLGAGATVALMVAAQLVTALLLDHLGAAGERTALTPARVLGGVLLIAGALLILWPRLVSTDSA